jgi:hypothetical protein
MPPPNTKAHMLIRMFDGDETKGEQVRRRILNKVLTRRDAQGLVIAEQKITQDKGKPPRQPPRGPHPPQNVNTKLTKEEREAELERLKREHGL